MAAAAAAVGLYSLRKLTALRIEKPAKPYTERIREPTVTLSKASTEVDRTLTEMAQVARERESAISNLQQDLDHLPAHEQDLKAKIDTLEQVSLPAAEHFARLVQQQERRSVRRDYLLFSAGVILTTLVALVLRLALP